MMIACKQQLLVSIACLRDHRPSAPLPAVGSEAPMLWFRTDSLFTSHAACPATPDQLARTCWQSILLEAVISAGIYGTGGGRWACCEYRGSSDRVAKVSRTRLIAHCPHNGWAHYCAGHSTSVQIPHHLLCDHRHRQLEISASHAPVCPVSSVSSRALLSGALTGTAFWTQERACQQATCLEVQHRVCLMHAVQSTLVD